ncbi:nitrite transporter NirC [Paraoerskovia marina]|uniref:Nitrite transporter NirC n=1 Tax=Paraoerskovia marina TaxID=545619 RepID=A0A1H1PPS2_9CELL|nr:formate/nitrite transporter family protein [Paraoerskovia marina]SDS13292.1 nitrite transporter NirC [Paraoerskovia marina]
MDVLTLPETVTEQSHAAKVKVSTARQHPFRYAVSAMLAGMYIGVGVVFMLATAGPFLAAGDPAYQLVSGVVFAAALTLVVFAGSELATSAMMILSQGVATRAVRFTTAVGTLALCLVGNLLGSMAFAWMVVQSKVLESNPAAHEMLASMLDHKAHETAGEMFFRGVLCNILVCAAIWACGRLKTEVGKAIVIFWAVFAFIASGFEHVVANMTTFSLGLFTGDMTTWATFGENVVWVGLGNLVGGAVVVGLGYVVVAGRITPASTGGAPDGSLGSGHGGAAEPSTAVDVDIDAAPGRSGADTLT